MLAYLKSRGVEGQLYFVTEFGYGGLEDIDAVLEKYGPKPNVFAEDYQGFIRQICCATASNSIVTTSLAVLAAWMAV